MGRETVRKWVNRFGRPRVIITDKLRSYIKTIRKLAPDADHPAHKGLIKRIEGSHWSTRKREKLMGRFKSPRQAQRFLSAHDQINTIFRPADIAFPPLHTAMSDQMLSICGGAMPSK